MAYREGLDQVVVEEETGIQLELDIVAMRSMSCIVTKLLRVLSALCRLHDFLVGFSDA